MFVMVVGVGRCQIQFSFTSSQSALVVFDAGQLSPRPPTPTHRTLGNRRALFYPSVGPGPRLRGLTAGCSREFWSCSPFCASQSICNSRG